MILQDWWFTTLLGIKEPIREPVRGQIKTDVLIVGAGAAGLAAALRLVGSGKKVVLIDKNICGGSSTGKSAGFLTPDSELELSQLLRKYGTKGAKDLWGVASKGVEIMVDNIKKHQIECDLQVQDCLFLGKGASGWKDVQDEVESREKLGYSSKVYRESEVPSVIGSNAYSGAIRYTGTYGVNALLYAQGIKQVLLDNGIEIYESSEVLSWEGHTVRTHLGSVTADKIIFCIDKPKPEITKYHESVYHAQTFLSISEPLGDDDIAKLFPQGPLQCWDSDLVYTYFRLTGTKRLLVGGGNMLTTYAKNDTTAPRVIDHVINELKEKIPVIRPLRFIQYWQGRIDMTRDLIPTVLVDPEHPWTHFVLGCVGLPWATFCGDFAARNVLDDKELDSEKFYRYFSPTRKFFLPLWLEHILGKKIVFTVNNAWAKYRQKDPKAAESL
ncbi:NAD(P)/FAD-dependent oxidoreductase [Candidatus Nitrosotalea okcheonensis]|uniref:Putative Glycine/D-amino acid oxidase (Deaminating) n=1 Tax=Candidatus Nitrosotalea okcheonensis TaxID=1903276 RepID=A0A2H1FIE8_9ARCH|nr:FAD-binding oxidoreductase [Candidatus Nitrosotalea okcheonensis]SMH72540.1 putative Glycine/D-amino acid oxidase (Deaminating) [Candidatus Nitrosotalea okcheonensis]